VADLQPICDAVLARIAADAGVTPVPTISAAALQRLSQHAFPGNVRELENLLQRALALSGGDVVELVDLGLPEPAAAADELLPPPPAAAAAPADDLAALPAGAAVAVGAALPTDLQAHLDAVERDILLRALERCRYNRTAAGASLGLTLRQMRYRMARLGVIAGDSLADPL
jgi:two-component system response regulator PilR (NtrC family)